MKFNTKALLAAALSALVCCSTPIEEELLPTFTQISDPDYTPADIDNWPAYAFVFSQDTSTFIKTYEKLSDLKGIDAREGDIISVIAVESTENIGFSELEPGKALERYKMMSADMSPIIPRTWGTIFTAGATEEGFKRVLTPITSNVAITTINAPESFRSATLTMEGFCNEWSIGTDDYLLSGSSRKGRLISTGDDVSGSFLPPEELKDGWTPDLSIDIADMTIKTDLKLDIKTLERVSVNICLDFTGYTTSEKFQVRISYNSIMNPSKVTTVSKTYSTYTSRNRHYRVMLLDGDRWAEQEVHDALCSDANKHGNIWNDWANSKKQRDTMSYCLIDTEFPATIRVRKTGNQSSRIDVRPSTYSIEVKDCGDNYIEFTLPSEDMGKVSVEFGGDRQHNLFIIARRPDADKPEPGAYNVKYYGKGEHNAGTIYLTSGQTLYIDQGAKVYANVKTTGSNITIAGHGILSGEKMKHHGDNMYSWGDFLINTNTGHTNSTNLKIKDITMIDSPGWNLIIPKTDGVLIDGVNMISWELNGDGIDIVSSCNVEIRNCFIRTYDDAITLKCRFIVNPISDVYNVNIHDCLIWADYARGIVIGPEAGNVNKSTGRIHDIKVKDCIFLQHKRGLNDDLRAAFAIGQGSDGQTDLWKGSNAPNTISNITASDLTFDNIDKGGRHVAIWQYGGSSVLMENINFSNFKILDSRSNSYPALNIKTNGSRISGMKVSNFTINGTKMTGSSSQLSIDKPANVSISVE
jgi:hypothetical protein